MGSGVYLGDGYVLTSAHVGCYPFRMTDGSFYQPDYKSWTVLQDGTGGRSDLAIFKVSFSSDSPLAKLQTLPVSLKAPSREDSLLLFGSGLRQHSSPSAIRSNGKILAVLGYRVDGKRSMAWGFNKVSEVTGARISTGEYQTDCFVTKFNHTPYEAQAAEGDSGGAAFVFNSRLKCWELAGCIIGISQKGTYIPFGSQTYFANLARYRSQFPLVKTKVGATPAVDSPGPGLTEESRSKDFPKGKEPAAIQVRPAVLTVQFPG
jgi:hypothetical protein